VLSDRRERPIARPDRWALVAVAGMLSFVAMLNMSVVNLALAGIASGLNVTPHQALWVVVGYQVAVVSLLLPAGRWLDSAGQRPALLFVISGFTLCALAAALAPSPVWLIASRVVQGAFAAAMFVLMPVLAAGAVRSHLRGRAMSVPASLGPLGAITGPAVGGVLLDVLGWRAAFFVQVPLCVAALLVVRRCAPREGHLPVPDRAFLVDTALIVTATVLVLVGLTAADRSPLLLLLLLAAPAPLALWARRGGRSVLAVLRESGTYGTNAAVLAVGLAYTGMIYVVALHLQVEDGVSAAVAGLAILAFSVAMAASGPLGGRLADRWGARRTALTGAAVTALGLASLLLLGDVWAPEDVAWRLAVAGAGMGLYGGPTQLIVMTSAPPGLMATAGSAIQLARNLGFTLGPPLAAVAWSVAGAGADARPGLLLATVAAVAAIPLLARAPAFTPHGVARVGRTGRKTSPT
jgi:MFS transporter, DHA2 family, multidrug resistance protein